MKTGDPQRASVFVASAERDMRRALKALDLARHVSGDTPTLEKTVLMLSDAIRTAKTASAMLLKSADAAAEVAAKAKRTKR